MSFLTPLSLLFGLLAIPIILLYMLRLRRREMRVSSTLLWQKLVRDREANAPWQRLRKNWLLILQLLILAALVLALARPFLPTNSIINGNVVVLIDASASMLATDVAPTRFEAARAEVGNLINDLRGSNQMTLIQAGQAPIVLAAGSNDRAALRQALSQAQPDSAAADWQAALALANGAAQGFRNSRIIIVSDGGLPDDLPTATAETVFVPIGNESENLGITTLATRDTNAGPLLLTAVHNYGTRPQTALLTIEIGNQLFDARRITIAAGENVQETWTLPPETAVSQATASQTAVISAKLSDQESDFLTIDDQAWAVHAGGISNETLLVTDGNLFLERVLNALPGIKTFQSSPENSPNPSEFDLAIFDSTPLPATLPATDMLIINPPADANGLIEASGYFSDTVAIRLASSPILEFVDWRNVHIRQAQAITAPWAETLVAAEGGPLILAGSRNGHRIVILTFDLRDSDLPLQIAFPILMANITGWLNPGRAFDVPAGLQPGAPVTITPQVGSTAVVIQRPDGTIWNATVGDAPLIFTDTLLPGVYHVSLQDAAGEQPAGSFTVNLFSTAESDIRPKALAQSGSSNITPDSDARVGQREFWPWLVGLAVLILLIEWWVHHRGTKTLRVFSRKS